MRSPEIRRLKIELYCAGLLMDHDEMTDSEIEIFYLLSREPEIQSILDKAMGKRGGEK